METSNSIWKTEWCRIGLKIPAFIDQRIAAVTTKRCAAELQQYLPEDVYRQLAEDEFEPLRQSLRELFTEWLEQ